MGCTTIGNSNALVGHVAPGVAGISALTNTTVVVVVRTSDGDGVATKAVGVVEDVGTPGERGLDAETGSAEVVELATGGDVNAKVGLGAEGLAGSAELDTGLAVIAEDVVDLTIATLVEGVEVVGLVIMGASVDSGEALLVVVS